MKAREAAQVELDRGRDAAPRVGAPACSSARSQGFSHGTFGRLGCAETRFLGPGREARGEAAVGGPPPARACKLTAALRSSE